MDMTGPKVGDLVTMTLTEYRWWERAIHWLTRNRVRMRGVKRLRELRISAVTSGPVVHAWSERSYLDHVEVHHA